MRLGGATRRHDDVAHRQAGRPADAGRDADGVRELLPLDVLPRAHDDDAIHESQRNRGYDRTTMLANLLLHVREHPQGRVIVTPVDFPELAVDADTSEAGDVDALGEADARARAHAHRAIERLEPAPA